MARLQTANLEGLDKLLPDLKRGAIKRILQAGAAVYVQGWKDVILQKHHVKSHNMLDSVGMADYKETVGSGSIEVYPQGTDDRGTRNATKAYVLHYGRKGHGRIVGDKFVDEAERISLEKANAAMQQELNKILSEQGG